MCKAFLLSQWDTTWTAMICIKLVHHWVPFVEASLGHHVFVNSNNLTRTRLQQRQDIIVFSLARACHCQEQNEDWYHLHLLVHEAEI
jgi:hypothetical protein